MVTAVESELRSIHSPGDHSEEIQIPICKNPWDTNTGNENIGYMKIRKS